MARMKRFLLYLILFVAFFIFTTIMTNLELKTLNQTIENIEVLTESPIISIDYCKAGKYSGNINGTIRNNTGKHIEKAFLKIDCYDNSERYIGTQYEELKYFNVNEILKFETNFKFKDVNALKLSVVYEENQVEQISNKNDNWSLEKIFTKENVDLALPIVGGMTLFVIF